MNLNELRIGNYVCTSYMNKSVFKVNAIHSDRLYFESIIENFKSDTIPVYVEPIKLTGEWLLKAKFEKHFASDPQIEDASICYSKCCLTLYKRESELLFYSEQGTIVKYVHQLQNLFFSLTGEELVFSSTEP